MESILNLFTLLLHLLPGLVLIRRRDWSGAVFCMALGILWVLEGLGLRWGLGRSLLSVLFLLFTLLWAAAVVWAGRRAAFLPLKKGSPLPVLCRVLGAVTLLGGAAQFISSSYTLHVLFSSGSLADQAYAVQLFVSSAIQIAAGVFMLAAPALRPCPGMLWAGIMVAAVLAPSSLLGILYALGFAGFSALIPTILGYALAVPVLIQPAPAPADGAEPPLPAAKAPPTARLRCVAGQFAGAEFPLHDGETLCLGSSPELAHVVLTQGGVAPLHAEVTYQRAQCGCMLAHMPENPVYIDGRAAPPVDLLGSMAVFTLGEPPQRFQVEL